MDRHHAVSHRYEGSQTEIQRAFAYWMGEVDFLIGQETGLSAYDLPDQEYRAYFDTGLTATEAARVILEAEGIIKE